MSDLQHSVDIVSGYVNLLVNAHRGWDTGGGGMCYPNFRKDVAGFAREYKDGSPDLLEHLRLIADDQCEYQRPHHITPTMMRAMASFLLIGLHDPKEPLNDADCHRYCVHLSNAIATGDRYVDNLFFEYSIDPQREAHYNIKRPYRPELPIEIAGRRATPDILYALAEHDLCLALDKAPGSLSRTGIDEQTPRVIQFVLDTVNSYLDHLTVTYEKDDYKKHKHHSVRALTWSAHYVESDSLQDRNLVHTWKRALGVFSNKDIFLTEDLLDVIQPLSRRFNPDAHNATPLMVKAVDSYLYDLKKRAIGPTLPSNNNDKLFELWDLLTGPHRSESPIRKRLQGIEI